MSILNFKILLIHISKDVNISVIKEFLNTNTIPDDNYFSGKLKTEQHIF